MNIKQTTTMCAVLMTMLLSACSSQNEEQEIIVRPVRTIVVNAEGSGRVNTFSGVSKSAQESTLSFKVSGTVNAVPAKVGDKISAGTTIASLDTSTYDLQLQQAQASVEQSRAAARNARTAYQRTRALYANNNASLGDLEASRANSESASAQLRAAIKSLELAQLNLSYTELKLDIDCSVDSISVEVNENVSTSTEVARVNCSDKLEVELAVPGNIIGNFTNGKTAKIKFDALPDAEFDGRVSEVGLGANGLGATFPVTVSVVDDKGLDIRPGLAASVAFESMNSLNNEYLLPLSAVVQGNDGAYVFLVEPVTDNELESEGVIIKLPVTIGALQTGGIEITSGLKVGHRVVVAGVSFVRNGMLVSF